MSAVVLQYSFIRVYQFIKLKKKTKQKKQQLSRIGFYNADRIEGKKTKNKSNILKDLSLNGITGLSVL